MLKQVQQDEEESKSVIEPWTIRLSKRLLMLHIIAGVALAGHYMPLLYRATADEPNIFMISMAWEVGITTAKIAIWYFLFRRKRSAARWVFVGLLAFIWISILLNGIYWHVNTVMMMGILTAILPLLFLQPSIRWFEKLGQQDLGELQ